VFDLSGPTLDVGAQGNGTFLKPEGRGRIFAYWELTPSEENHAQEDLEKENEGSVGQKKKIVKIGDGLAQVLPPQVAADKGVHTFVAVAMDDADHAYALFRDRDAEETRDFVAETMYPAVMKGAPAALAAVQLERAKDTIISKTGNAGNLDADRDAEEPQKDSSRPSMAGPKHPWAPVTVWSQNDEDGPWKAACTYHVIPGTGHVSFKRTKGNCVEKRVAPLNFVATKNVTGLSHHQHLHGQSSSHHQAVVCMFVMMMPLSVAFALVNIQ